MYHELANLEWGAAIGPDTRFHAASLAKHFTAVAVLQLRDRGLLDLDAPLVDFMPELHVALSRLTLRQLLTHTSGLRDQWPLMEWSGWRGTDVITTDDVLAVLRRQSDLHFEPGTRYRYSNSGYTLLGEVVARLSGRSFATYARREIFAPLGMSATLIANDASAVIEGRADAYRLDSTAGKYVKNTPNLYVEGSTSLLTTLEDYTQWMLAHCEGSEWRRYIDEMQQPHHLADGSPIAYGMAYILDRESGQPVAFHAGRDFGFTSFFAHYPAQDAVVAIFANASLQNLRGLAATLIRGDPPRSAPAADLARKEGDVKTARAWGAVGADYSSIYSGIYESDLGEICRIADKGGELYIIWGSEQKLTPVTRDLFVTEAGDEYSFSRDGAGKVNALRQQSALNHDAWVLRAPTKELGDQRPGIKPGRYFSKATRVPVDVIEVDAGTVALALPKQEPIPLERVDDRLYVGGTLWLRLRPDTGNTRFELSTPRCLGVAYEKLEGEN
jgi:CubicO group peptidase (beta-lactamase class C family)